jgi:hypothetical protein
MANAWLAVAEENQRVGWLLRRDSARSSISRSYYAVYAACSGWLEREGVPHGTTRDGTPRDNCAHERLVPLLRGQMKWSEQRWSRQDVDELEDAIRRLQLARTDADYDPLAEFTVDDVQSAARDAATVLAALLPDLER